MDKAKKYKVASCILTVVILSLCYVAIKLCNYEHSGWGLILMIVVIFLTFGNIYLTTKREDYLDSLNNKSLSIIESNVCMLPALIMTEQRDTLETLERIVNGV
ncbi:hypothetical protein UT300012_23590 [Paraclostridium bifermentans]